MKVIESINRSLATLANNVETPNGLHYYFRAEGYRVDTRIRYDLGIDVLGEGRYACLLYTSPSPRDLSTSRMPSSA